VSARVLGDMRSGAAKKASAASASTPNKRDRPRVGRPIGRFSSLRPRNDQVGGLAVGVKVVSRD